MIRKIGVYILATLIITGCGTNKNINNDVLQTVNMDTLEVYPDADTVVYHGSDKRTIDLIHTVLDVNFDWENQYLNGEATLTIRPYFYDVQKFKLHAKGFDIHNVAMVQTEADSLAPLDYNYDDLLITIDLGKVYSKTDTLKIFIKYTAKPNELTEGGSAAITSDKGLYFINPLGEEEEKPQQIWTQGETEASSCWFPTVDSPSEKMTQEIYITVADEFKTLSNGLLIFQTENKDGTRTDYWKQELPHSPYLVMMAIGDFFVYEDMWRDSIQVNYYVEQEFAKYAKEIFGKTPEMMEFYSKKLGVDYPWEKYSQVVVRDYVSGAMENTTAVIHGEFLNQTTREMIDGDNQDIIAHELFHHWFGDLVTCESWSNLPLNESFATYGEYLWKEHSQGREAADRAGQIGLSTYLQESRYKQENMIRFDYEDKEDMFDSHSYAKGGRILHTLRYTVGDDAFFASLGHYLNKRRFKTAEIHDLRASFEEVTGQDLNWFFNQWFMASGHPDLLITYDYDDSLRTQYVTIQQMQNTESTPVYQIPMKIDIYTESGIKREEILLYKKEQTFRFKTNEKPKLVNVDADKMLLCAKRDKKGIGEFIYQYYKAPLYLDRYEAVKACAKYARKDTSAMKVIFVALNDRSKSIRKLAIKNLKYVVRKKKEAVKERLIDLASNDKEPVIRGNAIKSLARYYRTDGSLKDVYEKAVKDQSYSVLAKTLTAITKVDNTRGMELCEDIGKEMKNLTVLSSIAGVYADHGEAKHHQFFMDKKKYFHGFSLFSYIPLYEAFLLNNKSNRLMKTGVYELKEIVESTGTSFIAYYAKQAIINIRSKFGENEGKLNQQLAKQNALETADSTKINELNLELDRIKLDIKEIDEVVAGLDKS